ncbi:hypothetical protein MA16_Dca025596 [Dendrobium catenatum]|uniref:Uncharacterized protein n=1 Tax=Dendrobium catenatum TaxID=906689 RepID=A0A2I0VAK2_9ASPA|nr:hypothetical protein MA16_Dca025596 [Dendrobium catenatum]
MVRKNNCTRRVSTDDSFKDFEYEQSKTKQDSGSMEDSELFRNEISPPLNSSSASSSGRKMETLESLSRADVSKIKSFRIFEEEKILTPTVPRLKATNALIQLITCGSISVKAHHSFGLVPAYKPKLLHHLEQGKLTTLILKVSLEWRGALKTYQTVFVSNALTSVAGRLQVDKVSCKVLTVSCIMPVQTSSILLILPPPPPLQQLQTPPFTTEGAFQPSSTDVAASSGNRGLPGHILPCTSDRL